MPSAYFRLVKEYSVDESEICEVLLRAILAQSDSSIRKAMIEKLHAKASPQVIGACLDLMHGNGHDVAELRRELDLSKLH